MLRAERCMQIDYWSGVLGNARAWPTNNKEDNIMSSQTDEETVKPCIQDRLRSIISRAARDILASWPTICITILILIIITLPESLPIIYGREVTIPIFSKISIEGRFGIFSSVAMIFILLKQNQINKSFLKFEQQRELRYQKRDHDLLIYARPINLLLTSLLEVNNILPRSDQKIDIHKHHFKDQEFFFEHLETGYQTLFQKMCDYQDSYNGIVDQVNAIYRNAVDLLKQKWIVEPDFNNLVPPLTSYIEQIMAYFPNEVTRRLIHGEDPQLACPHPQDQETILFGSSHIIIYSFDREMVIKDLNSILEGSEVFGRLQQIWSKVNPLYEDVKQIKEEIERIRASIHAGLNLRGSCSVGKEVGFE